MHELVGLAATAAETEECLDSSAENEEDLQRSDTRLSADTEGAAGEDLLAAKGTPTDQVSEDTCSVTDDCTAVECVVDTESKPGPEPPPDLPEPASGASPEVSAAEAPAGEAEGAPGGQGGSAAADAGSDAVSIPSGEASGTTSDEQKGLPPITEDGPAEAFSISFDHIGFKSDILKEAFGHRSASSAAAAAARSRHPRRPASELEVVPGPGVTEWSMYIMKQVDRLARRLDNLEREILPAMQRSAFEACRSQETRLKNWTDKAGEAINYLGEDSVRLWQEMRELQVTLAHSASLGRFAAAAGADTPRNAAPGSQDGAQDASASPTSPFTQVEVDRFASACQRAAAEATAMVTSRFEQRVDEQSALLEKEFRTHNEEAHRVMEDLSAQAKASLKEAWEELAAQPRDHGVAAEPQVKRTHCSQEASPGRSSRPCTPCGEKGTGSSFDAVKLDESEAEAEEGADSLSELMGLSGALAVVEKSASLRRVLFDEVSQVRRELQADHLKQRVRFCRHETKEFPTVHNWKFWSKALGCGGPEPVTPKSPAPEEKPALLERGVLEELVGGRSLSAPAAAASEHGALKDTFLIHHAAL